jgi:hypothetical protein
VSFLLGVAMQRMGIRQDIAVSLKDDDEHWPSGYVSA